MATTDTFYRKTKIFVIKSLEVLEEIKDREGIPLGPPQEEFSIKEGSTGGMTTTSRFVKEPDFLYFISKNWEKIKGLPEYEDCRRYMYENENINKHLDKLVGAVNFSTHIDVYMCLRGLILKIMSESMSLKFNEKTFTEYFEKLRNFFTNDKLQFYAFSLLEGFKADIDEFQLDKNLRIFKIPTHKKVRV